MRTAEELTRENDILRGMVAKVVPGCHYCGKDIAQCPHGFPGCSLADDIMAGDDTEMRKLIQELTEARAYIVALEEEAPSSVLKAAQTRLKKK